VSDGDVVGRWRPMYVVYVNRVLLSYASGEGPRRRPRRAWQLGVGCGRATTVACVAPASCPPLHNRFRSRLTRAKNCVFSEN